MWFRSIWIFYVVYDFSVEGTKKNSFFNIRNIPSCHRKKNEEEIQWQFVRLSQMKEDEGEKKTPEMLNINSLRDNIKKSIRQC